MKGMSLPIETFVILIVALIVLVVMGMIFFTGTSPSTNTMSHSEAWSRGCGILKAQGCQTTTLSYIIPGYNPDGVPGSILTACYKFYGEEPDDIVCKQRCCGY